MLGIALMLLLGSRNVQAESYSIENMDIQATVQQDGSLNVKQEITYQFSGHYNGIYIDIPYNLEDAERKEAASGSLLEDKFYNATNVKINSVSLINNGKEIPFQQVKQARNGNSQVYTIDKQKGIQQIRAYSPSTNTTKKFKMDYTLENVCVKHEDVGELYYNFIGGAWAVTIQKLNIDIYLPQNQSKIEIWGHGPYNGKSKIVDNTHANFKVQDVKPGQYVAARVLFDNSNIANSKKMSHLVARDLVHKDENAIIENKEEKNAFTWKIIVFAICLLVY